jgi:hypothetical protein
MKNGRCATMTHDYKRNGTATLFAALDALEGQVISMCDDRHRHQEWLKFLRVIDYVIPAGKQIHMIVDNYATRKHPKVDRWLSMMRTGNACRIMLMPTVGIAERVHPAKGQRCCRAWWSAASAAAG